ncbi:unnamed protein product [Didymodactylos carnosus]|uniref:Uncharacterized protein n=1 Tax=Didymodactylos carnosus TaxID=1234261 RepID=A0A814Y641_9BILA|nr:unnamed protein product [Didymodactylos carnosus]CAF1224928.1 unnamed protein product [Didymodactylos carnosus]CAF3856950.1 unnamed protein product [Didymodactylos carnosus]CAF3987924.1 unnamed protein product [Didymodactylos carnosus]
MAQKSSRSFLKQQTENQRKYIQYDNDHEQAKLFARTYEKSKRRSFGSASSRVSVHSRDSILKCDDYQAPLSSKSLKKNSNWLIVRRNLHRIRYLGGKNDNSETLPDFYLSFQMIRELTRAQDEIKNIDRNEHFQIIKLFSLAVDNYKIKIYNTAHITPNDALFYDRLGDEPLAIQNLLFYFSQQDVQYKTVFWEFLNEVTRVLDLNRKRVKRVHTLRKIAATLAIILFSIIGFMFLLLIVSLLYTTSKFDDPQVTLKKG